MTLKELPFGVLALINQTGCLYGRPVIRDYKGIVLLTPKGNESVPLNPTWENIDVVVVGDFNTYS